MDNKIYEISLTSLSQNGISCKNLSVTWEDPECINVTCDYGTGVIKVSVPDNCLHECIYATIKCEDDNCSDCVDSERIKICPCTLNSDCSECETCVNNMCVSTCPADQFCENDRCVDCDDNTPCPCNQICVAGDCQCSPGTFLNDKGCCVTCINDGDCPPCTICTPEGCIPIECPEGACDQETGDCVGCINSGDCTGENECCIDKSCECCVGFVRDLTTNLCVPSPDCTFDSDCEECEICVDGICEPVVCPEGYICVGGDCKPLCDCAEPKCSDQSACVTLDLTNCFCNECTGDCTSNGDCGDGCYCLDGSCTPKPCKGTCDNGADCGEGCGCQDGECVPCNSLDCNNQECESVLGCGCTGLGCSDIHGCDGDCNSSHDCGEGCTCFEGTCTPCADFSCENSDCSDRPNCACVDGTCEEDLSNECEDIFTVEKVDEDCDIKAELDSSEDCSCPKLAINTLLNSVSFSDNKYILNLDVELRKGVGTSLAQVKTLPKLGDVNIESIADNETPLSGTVRVLIQPFYDEYDEHGKKINANVPGDINVETITFNNSTITDTANFSNLEILAPGTVIGDFLIVSKVEVKVQQATDLKFPNSCEYKAIKTIDTFTVNNTLSNDLEDIIDGNVLTKRKFEGYVNITSSDIRYPLFTWFRSSDGSYSSDEIFRKLYVPANVDQDYIDILYGPKNPPLGKYPLVPEEGGLRSGKYYAVKNDCSCEPDVDLGKVVFCNPSELSFLAKECNKIVELLEPFTPCSVNQDLLKFGVNDPSSQVKYELYLNGQYVETFRDSSLGMVIDGTNNTMFTEFDLGGEVVTEISLKINHDDKGECTLVYILPEPDDIVVDHTVNCDILGEDYQVTIPISNNGLEISTITLSEGTVLQQVDDYILTLPKNVIVDAEISFTNGCSKVEKFFETCCDNLTATLNASEVACGEDLVLSVSVSGGSLPYNVAFRNPNGESIGSEILNTTTTDRDLGTDIINGVYSITVIDSNGCETEATVAVNVEGAPNVTFSNYDTVICEGDSTNITVNVDAPGVGGTLSYDLNGTVINISNLQSMTVLPPVSTDSVFTFINISTLSGCDIALSDVITIDRITTPTVQFTSPTTVEICSGEDSIVELTGTPGAIVSSNLRPSDILIGESGVETVTVSPNSNISYTVSRVQLGDCVGTFTGDDITVTVNPGTPITVLSNSCSTPTDRRILFNNVDSVVDQDNNAITVTANEIGVDPATVTQVTATYDNGNCVTTLVVDVTPCDTKESCLYANDFIGDYGASTLTVVYQTVTTVINVGTATYTNIGGTLYNTATVDAINAANIPNLTASYPTASEMVDGSCAGLALPGVINYGTMIPELIRVNWLIGEDFSMTSSTTPIGGDASYYIDQDVSFTATVDGVSAGVTLNKCGCINLP